jgi:hypothetical protein
VNAFIGRCAELVQQTQVAAVGEETSSEVIAAFARNAFDGKSALGQWCHAQKLEYVAFDLTDEQCEQIGIPPSYAVRLVDDGNSALAERLAKERFDRRELAWVEQIVQMPAQAVLLVIGSRHIESLRARLQSEGLSVHIAEINWAPTTATE